MRVYDQEVIERFWSKVSKGNVEECWLWLGRFRDSRALKYGRFTPKHGINVLAHRFSYAISKGHIPKGMLICHSCDNPQCVNPAHLWVGTPQENMADKIAKGRHRSVDMKGERNPRSVLTESQVAYMRLLIQCGFDNSEIGRWYGVTHSMVSLIRRGKSWPDVGGAELRRRI